jgi:hypothetical protein
MYIKHVLLLTFDAVLYVLHQWTLTDNYCLLYSM